MSVARIAAFLGASIVCCASIETANGNDPQRPNILLIVSEDNGPELGCYGEPLVKTPVLDKLAAGGVLFHNAYVPQAGCSQSRAALLTGLYPHQNGQIGLATWKFRMYRQDTEPVRQDKDTQWRRYLFTEYHTHSADNFYPQRTVRNARYKLIHNLMPGQRNPGYDFTLQRFFADLPTTIASAQGHVRASYHRMKTPPEYELYDLQTDPHEFRDLTADAEHAAALAELRQQLAAWRIRTNDPLLNPDNLKRLKAEIDACMIDGQARKQRLTLTYPDYFFASP